MAFIFQMKSFLIVALCSVFAFVEPLDRANTMAISLDLQTKQIIDDFILNSYLPANNHPALSLTVTNGNGSLYYTTGYGLMDVANQLNTTSETAFLIGSMSKVSLRKGIKISL